MSISNIFPPYADLPNGYTVTEAEWNGQFNSIFNYLNNTVKPAVDALQAAPAPVVGAQHFFDARLTLQTGVPISSVDQSAKTTIYLTPYGGNLIGLYSTGTSSWSNYTIGSDVSLAVPSIKRQLFDVFVAQSSGTLIMEAGLYKNVTATNSPTAGTAKVITCADTSPFSVGMVISVSDGSNAEECVITSLSTNVSITVDWLAAGYTTPNLASQTPVTALEFQDGVLVKVGDHSRRYVGTVLTDASGQTHDTMSARLVANFYHPVPRPMLAQQPTATWDYGFPVPTGWVPIQSSKTLGQERLLFVNAHYAEFQAVHQRMGSGNAFAIGFDSTTAITGNPAFQPYNATSNGNIQMSAHVTSHTTVRGRHFLQTLLQVVSAGGITITSVVSSMQVGQLTANIVN